MSISEHKRTSEGEAVPARRVEIFTGAGRRRSWAEQEKAAIVAARPKPAKANSSRRPQSPAIPGRSEFFTDDYKGRPSVPADR